jgi:hypothetical protein
MKKNVIKAKSFEFAVAVTNCCRELVERKEFVLSKQLLRSGTSIGANIREAGYANRLDAPSFLLGFLFSFKNSVFVKITSLPENHRYEEKRHKGKILRIRSGSYQLLS